MIAGYHTGTLPRATVPARIRAGHDRGSALPWMTRKTNTNTIHGPATARTPSRVLSSRTICKANVKKAETRKEKAEQRHVHFALPSRSGLSQL
eukprot:5374339-Pyramimonas_sp.AAC.2